MALEAVERAGLTAPKLVSGRSAARTHELAVVDTRIAEWQTLVTDLRRDGITVLVLDDSKGGIEQVSAALSGAMWTGIHFFSHGNATGLQLGASWIGSAQIATYENAIRSWRDALAPGADLLFYECDLAASCEGRALIEDFRSWANADVAASTNATGNTILGGDWVLEYQRGEIRTAIALNDPEQRAYAGTFSGNSPPTDLIASALSVAENSSNGTVVGMVTGVDPDTGDVLTYSLTNTAGGRFAINSLNGTITVANGALLDYETAPSHSVTVRVTDSGGATYDEMFAITVTNTNDAPTVTNGATAPLLGTNEDASVPATVGAILSSVNAADADSGALQGIAVTSKTGNGTWQYSTDGTTWVPFGSVSGSNGLLLTPRDPDPLRSGQQQRRDGHVRVRGQGPNERYGLDQRDPELR